MNLNLSRSPLLGEPGSERAWLPLLLVLLATLPPMLVGLGERDATHTMERVAVASAQETWLRQHGGQGFDREPDAWLMPSLNGAPRVVKPPLTIWLTMLAWSGADADTASAEELLLRARLLSVALAVVVVAATYWAGRSLGGGRLAFVAALVVATTPFLQRQGRTASYDIHMVAWVSLAVAAGLWAIRPFASPPGTLRRALGWTAAGLALAAAVFSKSPPLAALLTVAPLVIVVLLDGADRPLNALGIVWMLTLAATLVLPWYLYAQAQEPETVTALMTEYRAERDEFQPPWYYLGLFALVVPWTLWLIAGLLFPFLRSDGPPRRQSLAPWLWFVLIFVLFSLPGAKQQRYILPILPAAGLVTALVWAYHQRLADRGVVDEGVNLLRLPHWLALIAVSVAVGPMLLMQDAAVAHGWLPARPLGEVLPPVAVGASLVLVVIAVVGAWCHWEWRPMRAAGATGLWMVVLSTLLWHAYARAPGGQLPIRDEAAMVDTRVGDRPFYYLDRAGVDLRVDVGFTLYSQRIVPPLPEEELPGVTAAEGPVYLAVNHVLNADDALRALGWSPVMPLPGTLNDRGMLWVLQ